MTPEKEETLSLNQVPPLSLMVQLGDTALAKGVPDMEHCAAHLEAMRSHFLSLGGTNRDIVGAYQANFLFLGDEGPDGLSNLIHRLLADIGQDDLRRRVEPLILRDVYRLR